MLNGGDPILVGSPPSCAVREHQVSRTVRRLKAPFNLQPPVFDLISRPFIPRELSLVLVFGKVGITAIGVFSPMVPSSFLMVCSVLSRVAAARPLACCSALVPPYGEGTTASLAFALQLAVFVGGFDSAL